MLVAQRVGDGDTPSHECNDYLVPFVVAIGIGAFVDLIIIIRIMTIWAQPTHHARILETSCLSGPLI
jgi:hypothetical protein